MTDVAAPQAHATNAEQAQYWNSAGGGHWVEQQAIQDDILAPISALLFAEAALQPGERVIDIGCGCGATTLEAARRVGPNGSALGVDVSQPMVARARERAQEMRSGARFIVADATLHDFSGAQGDVLLSRFGVMFFGDPVLAFANIRRGLKSGARVVFACWRPLKVNEWMLLPLKAALKHVPRLPEPDPEDPGPFAFADEGRVSRILLAAGFFDVAMKPFELTLDIAVGRGFETAVSRALEIGPASRALKDQPEALKAAAREEIRAALEARRVGDQLPLKAAPWIVHARVPSPRETERGLG